MRYIGLDLGSKTLGIAISDRSGLISTAYKTIRFNEGEYDELIIQLKGIVDSENVEQIVLGLPKNMNNTIGERAVKTLEFKEKLESILEIDVILEDERWTTLQANKIMLEADLSRKKRKEKVDQLAATLILQGYLDKKNRKGR